LKKRLLKLQHGLHRWVKSGQSERNLPATEFTLNVCH